MEKNQIKEKVLNKYNCIKSNSVKRQSFKRYWREFLLQTVFKEFSKNDHDHIYNSSFFEKLVKNLMRGGNRYKVRKSILAGFKNFKYIVKIHPLFMYFYIIFYFLILIEFKSVQKSGKIIRVPKSIMGEEIFLLRTIKLFSNTLKNRWEWGSDLQTKLFLEFFNIMFFVKRSKFYSVSLSKYYNDTYENMKHISYRW